MFAHYSMRLTGVLRQRAASITGRLRVLAIVSLLGLVLQGCTSAPATLAHQPDPSDPHVRVPTVPYRSVTGDYKSQRPAEPLPWREQNDRITPQAKP